MKKRLYHEDGRAYTSEEYRAVEEKQAKRKAFWIRAAKDFAVIWVVVSIYFVLFSFLENNVSLREYFKMIPLAFFLKIPQTFILTCVFTYCIRLLSSGFWYFMVSITIMVWMFIYGIENSSTVHLKINGILYNIGGDYTLIGLRGELFSNAYYLFALFSFCILLYNPFKSVKYSNFCTRSRYYC